MSNHSPTIFCEADGESKAGLSPTKEAGSRVGEAEPVTDSSIARKKLRSNFFVGDEQSLGDSA